MTAAMNDGGLDSTWQHLVLTTNLQILAQIIDNLSIILYINTYTHIHIDINEQFFSHNNEQVYNKRSVNKYSQGFFFQTITENVGYVCISNNSGIYY